MMRSIFILLFLVSFSFAFSKKIFCEDVKKEIVSKEMVVTATRTEVSIDRAPASVELIKGKDLKRRNIITLTDALKALPGISVRKSKGLMDSLSQINLRGMPYERRTLIRLDGVPLNGGYYGGIKTFWQGFSKEAIDRIEVAKGPFSSLYGGNAMGGAVSIFTRMPKKREFGISHILGNDRYHHTTFYAGDVWKKFSFFISYNYKDEGGYINQPVLRTAYRKKKGATYIKAKGFSIYEDAYGKTYYKVGNKGYNGARAKLGYGKVQYKISKNKKIWFSAYSGRYNYFYHNPSTYLKDENGKPITSGKIDVGDDKYVYLKKAYFYPGPGGFEQNIYTVGLDSLFMNRFEFKGVASFLERPNDWYTTPSLSQLSVTDSNRYYVDMQISFPILAWQTITFGYAYDRNFAKSKKYKLSDYKDKDSKSAMFYRVVGRTRTHSFYLQDQIDILKNLTFYAGFRGDFWKAFGGRRKEIVKGVFEHENYRSHTEKKFCPKFSIVWSPFKKTVLKGSWGKAFRPPTIYELYKTWKSSWGVTYASNPKLDPEVDDAWEIGLVQRVKNVRFSFSYFENDLNDMIYSVYVDLKNKIKKLQNVGDAKINGYEIAIDSHFFKDKLRIFTNFTHYIARIEHVDMKQFKERKGKRLIMVPKKIYGGGIDLNLNPFYLTFIVSHRDKVYGDDLNRDKKSHTLKSYDGYTTCDLKVGWKIKRWAELSFSADNLFNARYYEYYKAPGRRCYAELKLTF